jgi:hypothetical protein
MQARVNASCFQLEENNMLAVFIARQASRFHITGDCSGANLVQAHVMVR